MMDRKKNSNPTGRGQRIYRQTGWETPLSKPLFEPAITPGENMSGIGEDESDRTQNELYTPQIPVDCLVMVCRVAWKRGVPLAGGCRMGDCTTPCSPWVSPHEGQPKRGEDMFGRVRVRAARVLGESMQESRCSGTLEPASRTDVLK